ncbi:hypothetical protein OROHE_012738 [Orobanche hederae]
MTLGLFIIRLPYKTPACSCGKILKTETEYRASSRAVGDGGDAGVFCKKDVSFIIRDDMWVTPNVSGSILKTLGNLDITDINGTELLNVTLGYNEIIDLMKGMFVSRNPLTELILRKTQSDPDTPKSEPVILLHNEIEKVAASNSKKMILRLMVQKSTNKLVFAQAEEDFVDFLFGLLVIPLAGVESLLSSNSSITSIDNLSKSIENINGHRYLKTKDTKTILLKPKLPYGYISPNQILPLTEASRVSSLYFMSPDYFGKSYLSAHYFNNYI